MRYFSLRLYLRQPSPFGDSFLVFAASVDTRLGYVKGEGVRKTDLARPMLLVLEAAIPLSSWLLFHPQTWLVAEYSGFNNCDCLTPPLY